MSEREQWWRECPDTESEAFGVFDEKHIGTIKRAYPAAGEWRTDIENAPAGELIVVALRDGRYGIWKPPYAEFLKGTSIVAWARIYPPSGE